MEKGIIGSMRECGVTESYKLKRQVVLSASEAAEMILRVDDSTQYFLSLSSVFAGLGTDKRRALRSLEECTEKT